MAYKKNDVVRVDIVDITDLGFGVARLDGIVTFVSDTVPGDICDVRIIKVNKSYLVARLERLISPSPERTDDRCRECACKSCAYKNITYENEAKRKEENVRHIFSRDDLDGITVAPITPSPKEKRYRNKAQYPISLEDGEYRVGFYAPKSHRVTPISDCPLTPESFSKAVDLLKEYFKENSLSVYDEKSGKGLLRHIYLRRGEVSGELLVTLVINGDDLPKKERLVSLMTEGIPETVGILININTADTNVVLGNEYKTVWGRDHIFDLLAGVELKITAPSFYQVNHGAAELIYAKAKELAAPQKSDTLLDLFCGAGSIGLSMADSVGELIGIEIVDSAVNCARENAKSNCAVNAHFFTGDASDIENLLLNAEKTLERKIEPNIVVLDPPRAGCTEELIDFIFLLKPERIVYISCNPKTLARDIIRFGLRGYETQTVYPYDLFPATGHCECVCLLTKDELFFKLFGDKISDLVRAFLQRKKEWARDGHTDQNKKDGEIIE